MHKILLRLLWGPWQRGPGRPGRPQRREAAAGAGITPPWALKRAGSLRHKRPGRNPPPA